uniref:Nitric oxide synthase-interacting protein zinc-finger domain-containing protein n=1 Tax=Chaetoceros debilis TaxID=122233 RepID=A0A7S3QGJ5_9STRA|mmetsp:Transcript_1688/g.2406  ORF Transcript_1688/g.2406 Transcript_1688/m.2406 type:complete len:326 (+) Transcript_1688:80-1057(+)
MRKSKQAGGHMPLTYSERSKLDQGTQSTRLTSDSQLKFGDCCLSLSAAVDPVVTPSGHIYSREAIVAYLLVKSKELKEVRAKYDAQMAIDAQQETKQSENQLLLQQEAFIAKDQGASQKSLGTHATPMEQSLKRKVDIETKEEGNKRLKQISFWLSEAQPEYTTQAREEEARNRDGMGIARAPPKRPSSPMSGQPLRLKDLTSITLQREGSGPESASTSTSGPGKCLCAVSGKAIITQPVVAIKKSGAVILKEVFDKLIQAESKAGKGMKKASGTATPIPTPIPMTCPITGVKIKEKDVMTLSKAASGFAASGEVVATKYTPTMT